MRKIVRVIIFIICVPLIGTMFVKPDKESWKREEKDTSVINESFMVLVNVQNGSFLYRPETLTELFLYRMVPKDMTFSASEDYIEGTGMARDPEQEYLKALAIVCRSNITYLWEQEGRPGTLDYDKLVFANADFSGICHMDAQDGDIRRNEIKKAVDATAGAVITKENKVIAAPFFTTSASDMFVGEAGGGVGFSLNYACELAKQGMDFYEILKYFFDDIKVNIYE